MAEDNKIETERESLARRLSEPVESIVAYAENLSGQFERCQQADHRDDALRILEAGRQLLALLDTLAGQDDDSVGLASLRHDVRNTIGIVSGYAEILEDEVGSDGEILHDLQCIQSETERFLALLDAQATGDEQLDSGAVDRAIGSLSAQVPGSRSETLLGSKVLLVDDHAENRELVGIQLNRLGIEVVEARSGVEALAALEQKSIDLILLDLLLPDINGFDLMQQIRQERSLRRLPIVIISGVKDERSAIRCIEAGASDYIVKPVNATLLRARVSSLLERKLWQDKEAAYLANLEASYDFIRRAFGRYLSNDVVRRLLNDSDGLTLGGERREVTVLMADIRSFSLISQELAPEDCVRLLNNYFAAMTDIIMSYQGTVDEFIGDGILAIFGAPANDPQHADHAVACALAMQGAMPMVNRFSRQHDLPELEIGIGLNTGPVVVGNIGSERRTKYGVVGHHVNIASRIESCTVGGQVLASAYTRDALSVPVDSRDMQEVEVKGSDESLRLYDIVGIGDPYNIALDRPDCEWVDVKRPTSVEVCLLQGGRVSDTQAAGVVRAVGERELLIDVPLDLGNLAEVRLTLGGADLYAKVAASERKRCYRMSLTYFSGELKSLLDEHRARSY